MSFCILVDASSQSTSYCLSLPDGVSAIPRGGAKPVVHVRVLETKTKRG